VDRIRFDGRKVLNIRRSHTRVHGAECDGEKVVHLERVASESVLGTKYDVWDVHTDKGRWWVITEPTNLYSQTDFPSMDNVLTFHIGLMSRASASTRDARFR